MYVKRTPNDDFDDRRAMAPARATEYYLFLVELTFAPYISRSRDDAETKNGTSDRSHLTARRQWRAT